MSESTVYGPTDNPVPEGPLQRIFEFHTPGGGAYEIAKFSIFRRMYSNNAKNGNDGSGAPVDEDFILETILTYTMSFAWPWNNINNTPATPPFDVPMSAVTGGLVGGTLSGQPALGGVTTFGADADAFGSPGAKGTSGLQGAGVAPGLRAIGSPGGTPPTRGIVPPPPTFQGRTAAWGSMAIQMELYDPGLVDAVDPGIDGGETYDSRVVNFSGLSYINTNGKLYEAIQAAVVPKNYSGFQQGEGVTGLNSNNRVDVWVLMQRPR